MDTTIRAEALGSAEFRRDYGLRYAYASGSMYKAIASKELVVAMGRAGLLGFLGSGGVALQETESSIRHIQRQLDRGQAFGVNLLANLDRPEAEDDVVDLLLRCGVRTVEASAFTHVTPSIVRFRLSGLRRGAHGDVEVPNRVIAKISHPEVAQSFLRPAPASMIDKLVQAGRLTPQEAELAREIPVASDLCVECDSGGHTDQGVAYVLVPAMRRLRDAIQRELAYAQPVRLGVAGGIGTPESAAAAFLMGADFILTGSVNQCTVEAGTSEAVKDLLQGMEVQDTDYAPSGDMFELGAKVQVLKKGLFFAARASKLHELYLRHASLDEIDAKTRAQIEDRYFRRSFDDVWAETRAHYAQRDPARFAQAQANPKQKMALVFRWYFVHTTRLALQGNTQQKVDYQVHCGPALGAFNQWVKGTAIEPWRERRVADIAERIMQGAAQVLGDRFGALQQASAGLEAGGRG